MHRLPNPLWVDRSLLAFWSRIAVHVPFTWLPVSVHKDRGRGITFPPFGCGHYGCVFPTGEKNLVCKVTTDVLEARFVAAAIGLKRWPEGIVHYEKIFALSDVTHLRRPVFVLWREEAYEVGNIPFGLSKSNASREMRQFLNRLNDFKECAGFVRDTLKRKPALLNDYGRWHDMAWDYVAEHFTEWDQGEMGLVRNPKSILMNFKGAQRIAVGLRICEVIAEFMENEPEGYLIGQALGFYLENGILLADVHANNVGRTVRADYTGLTPWVITDPGHAVFLNHDFDHVGVEVI